MKIGHIATRIWGSVHLDMARALQRLGHRVVVYTEDARAPSARTFTRLAEDGVEIWAIHDIRRNPWTWLPDRIFKALLGRRFFTTWLALHRYLRASRCDIYMVEGDWIGIFVALSRSVLRFRWIVCVHDHEYLGVLLGYPGEPSNRIREAVKRWVLRRADGVRANSFVTRDVLVRGGIDAARIAVLPLQYAARMPVAGDLDAYRSDSRAQVLALHGIAPGGDLVVAACRLTPIKGLELALRAFALVLQERPAARLLVCGGDRMVAGIGSYRTLLERLAAEIGIAHAVTFTGNIAPADVKRYYAAADLHVVPSHIETFNYSAVEAALAGTQSVMTDMVGSGCWLARAGAAVLVAGRDAGHFAAAMLVILEQPAGTRDPRALARRTAMELGVDGIAAQLAALLAGLAAMPARDA